MRAGKIILLNGASSSGKSSIAKILQDLFDEPYLHLGIDTVFNMIPSKCKQREPPRLSAFVWMTDDDRRSGVRIDVGPLGHKIMSGFHHACAAMRTSGMNLIIDHVLLEPAWTAECQVLFSPFRFYCVGVFCSLEILERRERERGDRQIGLARFTALNVHTGNDYDMTIDTSFLSPRQCAEQICRHISKIHPLKFPNHQVLNKSNANDRYHYAGLTDRPLATQNKIKNIGDFI